ncbi:UNVERIFIED_CONTAM: hypothetical protein Sradi_0883400, partial [Sesamum radiatum]
IMSKNPLTVILDNDKFNGTNYTDWLRNLRIVLDYENQGYIMEKPLPHILLDGSSSKERETFERWHVDHRKVRSIILASMSNDVQKQYDKLDDVASILQRMKEVYTIPDRHISGNGQGKEEDGYSARANDICAYCREKGHWKRDCPNLSSNQGMFVVEINMVTNSVSWVLDTSCGAHICKDLQMLQRSRKLSKDEVVLRLSDGKAVAAEAVGIMNLVISDRVKLELKNCYFVSSMIKNIIFIPLLDNDGFELLINKNCFYLMKDGSSHLLDYLKENGIVPQWTPPGTPQLNGVVKRMNRALLDMIRYMMSFTELPLSCWGYALETAARLLNIAPSKTVAQTPNQIWHGKPASYKYLRVWGSPAYVKRLVGDKLDLRSSLCRSARVPQPPERYGFLGVIGQLDNNPKTYGEAMSDIDSGKWLEAMKSKIDSMSSNQVWKLVDRPKGV